MENVRLSFPDLGEVTVSVRHFHVEEAMSGLFAARIVAVSPMESIDLSRIVGSRAVVELEGTTLRRWRGLCEMAEFVRISETAEGLATYEFMVVPTLWRLTQRRQNRLFQHITIPDLVDSILGEWGIERQWHVDRDQYPRLELRTQYGESDFALLSRLLEEAGIAYWFQDDGKQGDALLHLGDRPERNTERAGAPLPFTDDPSQAFAAHDQFVTKVRLRERSRPGRVMLRDHDFQRPRVPLYARADAERETEHAHEQYEYAPGVALSEASAARSVLAVGGTPVADDLGVSRSREPHAERMALRRLEALQAERRILTFETSVNNLSPGTVFRIGDHPRDDISADKTLLSIRHVIEGKVADPKTWTFAVVAVDTDKPWRPSRVTPKPRIHGLQTAVVVGPGQDGGGPAPMRLPNSVGALHPTPLDANATIGSLPDNEIYVDEHGRVRVQFPWDREHGFDKLSSIWMRVSQGWAGSGYGMFTIPRVGHEVLVAFLDGDPDCPLIVGRVHNGTEPTPFPLPQNKTVSTLKTASSPGGGGFNELRFDDAAGREHVYLQAQKNMDHLVKNDLKQAVGGDTSRYAQGDDSTAVGGRRTKFVNLDEVEATGVNRSVSVGANRVTNIGSEDSTFVGSRWSVTVARGLARKLLHEVDNAAKNLGESVRSVADTVMGQIPGDPLANPFNSALADFGRRAFGSFRDLLALATDFETDPGPPPTTIEVVDRQIKLSTGEASIVLDGPNVTITAQGVVAIHAMDHISILAEKEVAIAARGKAAIVSATDDVLVQASKDVHLNPYSGGSLQSAKAARGEVGQSEPPPPDLCAHCGEPLVQTEDGLWACPKTEDVPEGEVLYVIGEDGAAGGEEPPVGDDPDSVTLSPTHLYKLSSAFRSKAYADLMPVQGAPEPNALHTAHWQMILNTAKGAQPLQGIAPIPAAPPGVLPGWRGIKEHVYEIRDQLKPILKALNPATGAEVLGALNPLALYAK